MSRCVAIVILLFVTDARAEPALWVTQGAHTKLYLFGTMHILPKPMAWFDGEVKTAFDSSGNLWVEADVGLNNPSTTQSLTQDILRQGVDPAGNLWTDLPPASAAAFRGELAKCHMSPDHVAHFRPWLAAMIPEICDLQAQSAAHAAFAKPADVHPEEILLKSAAAGGKQINYLETAAEQIGYFAAASKQAQLEQLQKSIDDAVNGKDDFAVLETAWAKGDVAAITKVVAQMRTGGEAAYQVLLVQRNIRFAAKIKGLLAGKGTIFVAIGAAHLAGPDSVQAQLTKLGVATFRQ